MLSASLNKTFPSFLPSILLPLILLTFGNVYMRVLVVCLFVFVCLFCIFVVLICFSFVCLHVFFVFLFVCFFVGGVFVAFLVHIV